MRARTFDVVLLDISMPDKNGIDTLKTLKQLRPELPVLMLSGYAEDQYAVNLLRAGAAGLPQQGGGVDAARRRDPHGRARAASSSAPRSRRSWPTA